MVTDDITGEVKLKIFEEFVMFGFENYHYIREL